jgi:UDP:flavonoid glycosyltransferase YjiC (YdhE family)
MRRPRLLFYAVNGLGLGHVTRLLAIARRVRHHAPEAEIVFLTSSEAEDVLYREGFAAFKVPSKTLRAETHLRAATYARMLHTIALNLLAAFHPHVLVVDTFPAGVLQELLPVLRWDSRKVFIYRVQRPEVALSPLMLNTLPLYDLALIPHQEGEETIPLPQGMPHLWTGPILIRDRSEAKPRPEARRQLRLPDEGRILYITFGGGGDREMAQAMRLCVEALADSPDVRLAVAQAPLYRQEVPCRPHVTPVAYYPMAELYPAFDGAISAAGYNSTMELLHHGIPTALVPFPRQVDDQEARVQRLAEAGAALKLAPFTAESVQETANRLLSSDVAEKLRAAGQERVPDSGADRAARAILEQLPA